MMPRYLVSDFEHSEEFLEPQTGRQVYPHQLCPKFEERYAVLTPTLPECYFCKYADFHLRMPDPPEQGDCCYPKVMHKEKPPEFVPWRETAVGRMMAELDKELNGDLK